MLYVFQMDIGQMLTFDMSLLMDTVARLQTEICKTTGISVDQQILLLSGGQSLKADQKVMTYGAGADTNPVFLFSKHAIESQEPPVIRSFMASKDALIALKERTMDAMKLRPSFDTVNLRAKLAIQIRDGANSIYSYCRNEFQEQHLQHQGWAAVIANLEEIADALQKTEIKFTKVFHSFLSSKETQAKNLEGFGEVLELISRIPLLDSLKDPSEGLDPRCNSSDKSLAASLQAIPNTLMEWICSQAQGQGVDCLHQKCEEDLKMFNESMFESYDKQVQDLLSMVRQDPNQMKELVGIERRLSELEKRLNEAKRIATTQNDLAQGFVKHQSKLGSLPDVSSILPDLCETHKQQLVQMLDGQQRIVALQNNFRNSKQEMTRNIHQRLGWVMHVETKIAKLDSELIFHIKTLKVLECNLDLLSQIKISPTVYADLVVETARRRKFSDKFTQWAGALEEGSNHLYETETERRKLFSEKYGDHFLLHTMFKGFEDKPPSITTKVPRLFDANLPEITTDEISLLKSSVPELEESLSIVEVCDQFPSDLLCTYSTDKSPLIAKRASPLFSLQVPQSHTPCVVTATEGPATPFTVPELHSSSDPSSSAAVPAATKSAHRDAAVGTQATRGVDQSSQDEIPTVAMKETQTSVTFSSHESRGVGTTEEAESDSGKVVAGGKPVSTTESSSPHSSTEFATADFYFEESMPSPMAESSAERKSDEQTKSMLKETLDNQLREKGAVIEDLNARLRQKEEAIARLQSELRTARGENSEEHLEFFSLIGPLEEQGGGGYDRETPSPVAEVKDVESTWCQTDTKTSVDERVKDLEQKLEKLTVDLDQSQLCLMKAEENLEVVQKQEQASLKENGSMISQLQAEMAEKDELLLEARNCLDSKEAELARLRGSLDACSRQEALLQQDSAKVKDNLAALQTKVRQAVHVTRLTMPGLRGELDGLKASLKADLSEFEDFKSSAITAFGKEIASFSGIIDSLEKERETLKTKVAQLEDDGIEMKVKKEYELVDLQTQINELHSQLLKQEELFAGKYAEQKTDFDCALQDVETKHALEMELELDKCKAEAKASVSEWERRYEEEKDAKNKLLKDLSDASERFETEREELKRVHLVNVSELEAKHKEFTEKCVSDLQEKLDDYKGQVHTLEVEAAALAAAAVKEKADCLESLRSQLVREHADRLQEANEGHQEQVQKFTEAMEEMQINHSYKLAELKKSFDEERDKLQSELSRYRDSEVISSQTQTERELLAEVISLTSSASDGMEELTALRVPEDADTAAKPRAVTLAGEEDVSKQLETARETIRNLEEKLKTLTLESNELKDRLSSQEEAVALSSVTPEAALDRSQYQSLMQTSATGKSFILMDKEKQGDQSLSETDEMKLKDQKIAHLEKHIMELSMTTSTSGRTQVPDKISFRGCDIGDLVLLCLDEKHDQYVVFTVGTNLHFLHSESLESLGLKSAAEPANKKPWILAKVMDKEYCLAKKPNNRFRVPQGTCFYRVKCQPWRCEVDLSKHKDADAVKQKAAKADQHANGNKGKKTDKK